MTFTDRTIKLFKTFKKKKRQVYFLGKKIKCNRRCTTKARPAFLHCSFVTFTSDIYRIYLNEKLKAENQDNLNMSVSKRIKSLKIQRCNESMVNLEDKKETLLDESKEYVENLSRSPESSTPVHSTPKRSSTVCNSNQEQLELRLSPMLLPCTQDGGNEVAWDWQNPSANSLKIKRNKNNGENIGTPKRTALLQKKRNSNSPLLHKPIKRKLLKNDNQKESFEIFTAEMRALSERIKTVPKEDDAQAGPSDGERSNENKTEFVLEVDSREESKGKEISTNSEDRSLKQKVESTDEKNSLDDLFDDSIEDCLVKCSQEVEEKLRLESCRENNPGKSRIVKDFAWHQQSYSNFIATKEKSISKVDTSSTFNATERTRKKSISSKVPGNSSNEPEKRNNSNSKSLTSLISASPWVENNNRSNITVPLTSKSGVVTSKQSQIFQIPDDSFDEEFLDVCFDDVENETAQKTSSKASSSATSSRYGKCYTSPHTKVSSGTLASKVEGTTGRKLLVPSRNQLVNSNANLNEPRLPRIPSIEVMETNSTTSQQQETPSSTSSRKFFKTKSLSASNFDAERSYEQGTQASARGKLFSSTSSSTGTVRKSNISGRGVSVSNAHQQSQQQRIISSVNNLGNNARFEINGNGNSDIVNFDRNGSDEDGSRFESKMVPEQRQNGTRENATGSQFTQMCTPEEIERKHREAKMKLEMKRKLQARSKSAGLLPHFPANKPPLRR